MKPPSGSVVPSETVVRQLGIPGDVLTKVNSIETTDWAFFYLDVGLKPLPKAVRRKHPAVEWKPYEAQVPTASEIRRWFGSGTDGVCLLLDGTDIVVLDCDGPREQAQQLLRNAGITIPPACPRVITGRDRDHFYFTTNRPVGRHVALLNSLWLNPLRSRRRWQ